METTTNLRYAITSYITHKLYSDTRITTAHSTSIYSTELTVQQFFAFDINHDNGNPEKFVAQ